MTTGSPMKLLIQFSISILLGNLFQQVYTLADRIIVGRYVDDTAFSAIGAKDEKGTAASIANGMYANLLITLVMTAIALDLLFVLVFRMGVAGTALATVLSEAIAAVLCLIYAFIKVPQFRLALKYHKPDKLLLSKTFGVGIPTGFQLR